MALITSENRTAWQNLANDLSGQFPGRGKTVRVVSGKKHINKTGVVFWHGPDKFANTRYKSDAQLMLRDLSGREGFRIGVETQDGEKFFIAAERVEVING